MGNSIDQNWKSDWDSGSQFNRISILGKLNSIDCAIELATQLNFQFFLLIYIKKLSANFELSAILDLWNVYDDKIILIIVINYLLIIAKFMEFSNCQQLYGKILGKSIQIISRSGRHLRNELRHPWISKKKSTLFDQLWKTLFLKQFSNCSCFT